MVEIPFQSAIVSRRGLELISPCLPFLKPWVSARGFLRLAPVLKIMASVGGYEQRQRFLPFILVIAKVLWV